MLRFLFKLLVFGFAAAVVSFYMSSRSGPTVAQRLTASAVTISELTQNPTKFDGTTVQVTGKPVPGARLTMLGFGGYYIEDGAGHRVGVLVKRGIPPVDAATGTVSLIGVMKNLVELGSFVVPVVVVD